jgi:hypothetical protein
VRTAASCVRCSAVSFLSHLDGARCRFLVTGGRDSCLPALCPCPRRQILRRPSRGCRPCAAGAGEARFACRVRRRCRRARARAARGVGCRLAWSLL